MCRSGKLAQYLRQVKEYASFQTEQGAGALPWVPPGIPCRWQNPGSRNRLRDEAVFGLLQPGKGWGETRMAMTLDGGTGRKIHIVWSPAYEVDSGSVRNAINLRGDRQAGQTRGNTS